MPKLLTTKIIQHSSRSMQK